MASFMEQDENSATSKRVREIVAFMSEGDHDCDVDMSGIVGAIAYGAVNYFSFPTTAENLESFQHAIIEAIERVALKIKAESN